MLIFMHDYAGNLLTRTDARNRTTTYNGYDGVNRPSSVTYQDGTPTVNFTYDGVANGMGQLTSITNGNSTTNYTGFDAMGRVMSSNQQIGGKTYNFSYGYNLAGALTSEMYPSGRVATTTYDQGNRPVTLSGNLGGIGKSYVNLAKYFPNGLKYWTIYGNSASNMAWNIWGEYNARLQPTKYWQNVNNLPNTALRMESPNWVDGSGHNNGTLQGTTILAGGPDYLINLRQYQQTFGYDRLNRLTAANENGNWSQTYQYDTWGNMWMPTNSLGAPAIGPGAPNVNVYSASGPGNNRNVNSMYDAAGNLTMFGAMMVSYDAENRQIYIAAGATSYSYDGAGQRVKKTGPGGTTIYVYDAFGQLAAEYASGPATGSPCGTTCYLSYDLLGSVRMVTDGQHNVIARHDYAPFGQEIPAGVGGRTNFWAASDSVNQKFTGYERDAETALDFAQARYMSSGLGRFMSPDPGNAGADFTNPQSWNAYGYVLGNPLGLVDPSGMSDNPCSSNFSCLAQIPGCLDDVTACQQKVFWPDTALGWDPFRLIGIPVTQNIWSSGGSISPSLTVLSGKESSVSILYSLPPGWTSVTTGNAFSYAAGADVPLEGWGDALRLVGQNVDAQKAFLGNFAAGSAAAGALAGVPAVAGGTQAAIAVGRSLALTAAARAPQIARYLFAQGDNKNIAKGILNANNYLRVGIGFNGSIGREVFRISVGSKAIPLPGWIPGLVNGTLHIDLWKF
jgi:RHS repeat-associated protein